MFSVFLSKCMFLLGIIEDRLFRFIKCHSGKGLYKIPKLGHYMDRKTDTWCVESSSPEAHT